jgi:hypothetical protein
MASGKSQYLSNGYLKASLENTAFTPGVTTLYAALTTATPTASQTAGTIVEVVDTNYTRQPITSASGWTPNPPTTGTVANTALLSFFGAGAATGPHSITSIAIVDSASGAGNLLYFGDVSGGPKTINGGDTASVAIGALTITEA